ncbi:MAG: tRNA guanosine(34) transglycosylase Tgt [bacterium]
MANFFKDNKQVLFMPDATYGIVNSASWNDISSVGTKAIVTNTLHLYMNAGDEYILSLGGFKKFTNWSGGVITDSGGFQAYSLVNRGLGKMFDDKIEFINPRNGNKYELTPEKSIDIQLNLRSDVIIVLDDCIHPDSNPQRTEKSVEKTTRWARICKVHFQKRIEELKISDPEYDPMIFCVIQGGKDFKLRKKSFDELADIGFDGFGFGGWPTDTKGIFLDDLIKFNSDLVLSLQDNPKYKNKHIFNYAMGVGYPEDIQKCIKWGYNLFDCVIPTRNARHGLLYTLNENMEVQEIKIGNEKYNLDQTPIKIDSKTEELRSTTRAYLKYLFKIKDPNALRIATMNNLEMYNQIVNSQK